MKPAGKPLARVLAKLKAGEPVTIVERTHIGSAAIGDGSGWLVSCGVPFPGVSISVLDEDGGVLAPARLGEIAIIGRGRARVHV